MEDSSCDKYLKIKKLEQNRKNGGPYLTVTSLWNVDQRRCDDVIS